MKKSIIQKFGVFLMISGLAAALAACTAKPEPGSTSAAETAETETAAQESTSVKETEEAAETETEKENQETTAAESGEAEAGLLSDLKLPDYPFTFENFPRMDGSTATVPLAKAVAGALLKTDPENTSDLTQFNRTTQSFRNLLAGEKDILIVGEPNASVFQEMKDAGFKYEIEEIATDALIFVVNEANPVDSLTTEQIRDIYTGKITNWKEVGGNDEEIIPFQRNEGAGSQALMVKLVMKDTPLMDAPKEYIPTSMGDLMSAVKSYDNSANAIGYSVYYYANDMKMAKGLKIIAVDGVQPEPATIRAREYPHLNAYYCVIPAETDCEGAKVIYDWLMTEDGQRLAAAEGYVSVLDVPAESGKEGSGSLPAARYTRLDNAPEGTLTEVQARDDYGLLIPYDGSELYDSYVGDDDEITEYVSGYMKGFFDTGGRLVTDPVYNDIDQISYYESGSDGLLPAYRIVKYDRDLQLDEYGWDIPSEYVHQRFVLLDGSFVSPEYGYISGMRDHIFCKPEFESKDFVIYDLDGKEVMTRKSLDLVNGSMISEKMDQDYGVTEVTYGEGYYLISLSDGYYYLDAETGRITYGPYSYASAFHDGRAFVRTAAENEACVIDSSGQELIGSGYSYASILANGNILAETGEDIDLYDKNGKIIKRFPYSDDNTSVTDWGFLIRPKEEEEINELQCYDCDGNRLLVVDEAVYDFNYHLPVYSTRGDDVDATAADASENGSGLWVGDMFSDKSVFLKGAEYVDEFQTMDGYVDLPYLRAYAYDTETDTVHYWVLDEQLETKLDIDGYINVQQDGQSGNWYLIITEEDSGRCTVLDSDLNEIAKIPDYPRIWGDVFVVNEEHVCRAINKEGDEVFCYPMIGSLGG